MEMTTFKIWHYKTGDVRLCARNGQVWFVGRDIAELLGHRPAKIGPWKHQLPHTYSTTAYITDHRTGVRRANPWVVLSAAGVDSILKSEKDRIQTKYGVCFNSSGHERNRPSYWRDNLCDWGSVCRYVSRLMHSCLAFSSDIEDFIKTNDRYTPPPPSLENLFYDPCEKKKHPPKQTSNLITLVEDILRLIKNRLEENA